MENKLPISTIRDELFKWGEPHEINQYLDSLTRNNEPITNIPDTIEDFKNYIADKSL